jgi:hypothetical protein
VNNIKSSPIPIFISDLDCLLAAKEAWNEMLEADGCFSENFDVQNGVLGLHQYVYLNIIQFLGSPTVRKV